MPDSASSTCKLAPTGPNSPLCHTSLHRQEQTSDASRRVILDLPAGGYCDHEENEENDGIRDDTPSSSHREFLKPPSIGAWGRKDNSPAWSDRAKTKASDECGGNRPTYKESISFCPQFISPPILPGINNYLPVPSHHYS